MSDEVGSCAAISASILYVASRRPQMVEFKPTGASPNWEAALVHLQMGLSFSFSADQSSPCHLVGCRKAQTPFIFLGAICRFPRPITACFPHSSIHPSVHENHQATDDRYRNLSPSPARLAKQSIWEARAVSGALSQALINAQSWTSPQAVTLFQRSNLLFLYVGGVGSILPYHFSGKWAGRSWIFSIAWGASFC